MQHEDGNDGRDDSGGPARRRTRYSFVVRIWRRTDQSGTATGPWLGEIESVPSGEKPQIFKGLDAIPQTICKILQSDDDEV